MATKAGKARKIPERLCVGCQERHPKKELIRIVRSPEARKGHRLERSFECAIDASVYDALAEELEKELKAERKA